MRLKTFAAILLILGVQCIGLAQQSDCDLKDDIETLKRDLLSVRQDLMEIKSLLSKTSRSSQNAQMGPPQANVKDVEFDLGANPIKGKSDARIILVEITDYQCPYCSRFVRETFPKIAEQYIDKGAIRYGVIDMPLKTHKFASKAAEATHCANDQGKFWEMHNAMMSEQDKIADLASFATALKLNADKFGECLKSDKYKEQIEKETELSLKLGVLGVPGFIVAAADPSNPSKAKGISFIAGALPFDKFKSELDQVLAEASAKNKSK